MKKQYTVPKLTSHGNVEAITEFFGQSDKNDFLFFSGSSSPATSNGVTVTGDGSIDGVIIPKTRNGVEIRSKTSVNE
jgi:hypothetical protein